MNNSTSTGPTTAQVQGVLTIICDLLTAGGSLFTIFSILLLTYKRKLDRHRHLLLVLACVGFVFRVGTFIITQLDWENNRALCVLYALYTTFFNLATFFWSSAIAINIFLTVFTAHKVRVFPHKRLASIAFYFGYHGICWGGPITIITVMAILTQYYYPEDVIGNIGGWCWVSKKYTGLRMGLFYAWTMAFWIFNVIVLILLVIGFRRIQLLERRVVTRVSLRVSLYVVVFVVCWMFGCIIRLGEIVDPTWTDSTLTLIHTVCIRSMLFWISVVFAANGELIQKYTSIFRKCFFCCKPQRKSSGGGGRGRGAEHKDERQSKTFSGGISGPSTQLSTSTSSGVAIRTDSSRSKSGHKNRSPFTAAAARLLVTSDGGALDEVKLAIEQQRLHDSERELEFISTPRVPNDDLDHDQDHDPETTEQSTLTARIIGTLGAMAEEFNDARFDTEENQEIIEPELTEEQELQLAAEEERLNALRQNSQSTDTTADTLRELAASVAPRQPTAQL